MGFRIPVAVAILLGLCLAAGFDNPPAPASAATCGARPRDPNIAVENNRFAVWFKAGSADAETKAQKVLNALTGPISNAFRFMDAPVAEDGVCGDGGTAGIDFYLLPKVDVGFIFEDLVAGVARPLQTARGSALSGFAAIDQKQSTSELLCTAAHEYFHILQFRYGRPNPAENKWWVEGTATWSEFAYKGKECKAPGYHAELFMKGTNRETMTELSGDQAYQSWLWPLFVQRSVNPRFVRSVFERMGARGPGALAAQEIDDQYWRINFPDFVLHQFNKGKVEDFNKWQATGASAKTDDYDMSLNGKPVLEKSFRITVDPAAGYHVLVPLWKDVNTRDLEIDVSDFTRQAGAGAALRVLLQPTMGPSTTYTFDEWDDAKIENWSTVTKKRLCRDDEESDYQAVMLAFSNTKWDGKPISARIKLRSEALCPWRANAHILVNATPPAASDGWSATGSLTRGMNWSLEPADEPVLCPTPGRACLPMTGTLTDAVNLAVTSHATYTTPRAEFTTRLEEAGHGRFPFKAVPGPKDLLNPVLLQEMRWDPRAGKFRAVMSVTLVNYVVAQGIQEQRTPARKAFWRKNGSGFCSFGEPDYTYVGSNEHGLVQETWSGCGADEETYGVSGPLFFDVLAVPTNVRGAPSNVPGDGICRDPRLWNPWPDLSGGPCWALTLEPYAETSTHRLDYTGNAEPPAANERRPREDDWCREHAVPCTVSVVALAGNTHKWPETIAVTITLKLLPVE